nr:MAG TPA: hypothetical protein [Caudoviricetes sp.]
MAFLERKQSGRGFIYFWRRKNKDSDRSTKAPKSL